MLQAANITWNDLNGNSQWESGSTGQGSKGNWSPTAIPGATDDVYFAQSYKAGGNVNVNSVVAVNGMFVTSTQSPITFSVSAGQGYSLTLLSGSFTKTAAASGTQTFAVPLIFGTNGLMTVDGGGLVSVTSVISGSSASVGVTKSGTGILAFSGANTYTGATSINQGVLQINTIVNGGTASTLGASTSAASNLVLGGGTLDYTGATATTDRGFQLTASTTSTISLGVAGTNLTFTGTTTGGGTLVKTGVGTLTLGGATGYSGPTTVSGGTLALGATAGISMGSAITLQDATTLAVGRFASTVGSLTTTGNTTLAFTGSAANIGGLSMGALALGSGTDTLSINFTTSPSAVRYTLINYTSLSGTFDNPTPVSGYRLVYGGSGTGTVDLAQLANQTFAATAGVPRALAGSVITVTGTLSNTSASSAYAPLDVSLSGSSANPFLGFNSSSGATVAGNASSLVTGTLTALASAGTQAWTMRNVDTLATTGTTTASGSLAVVNQRVFASPATLSLGRLLLGASVSGTGVVTSTAAFATTASSTLGNSGGAIFNGVSLGGGNVLFNGTTTTASYTLGGSLTGTAGGAVGGTFTLNATDEFGNAVPGAASVAFTGTAVNQRVLTQDTSSLALGNVRTAAAVGSQSVVISSTGVYSTTANATIGSFVGGPSGLSLAITSGSSQFNGAGGSQSTTYGLAGSVATAGPVSGTLSASVTAELGSIPSVAVGVTGSAYDWANAKVSTATLAFGNVRTGSAATAQTVAVGNQTVTNASYQDLLNVSGSTNNAAVTATGFSNLAASTNGATTGTVSFAANTTIAGSLASTASLTYTSNANGVAGLSNGSATFASGSSAPSITTTGGVYDYANAKVSGATLAFGNVRTGSAATAQTVAVGNQTVTNASYQDLLNVSGSTGNGAVTVTGFTNLAASASGATTGTVSVAANTATAGSLASTVSLTYTSNANGVAGLSNGSATIVGGSAPSITTTGGVYDYANAVYTGTAFNFGVIHQGGAAASGTVAIGNQTVTSASYQDLLDVSASTGNALVSASGFNGLGASAGGATRNNLVVAIGTGTAGSLNSTVSLSLVSNANGVAGLSNGTASVVGTPGAVTTTGTVYSGQSVWNTNGSGQWGTLSSNFGTNWQTFNGSPGLDAGFTNTDTATFGGVVTSGTATVTITAATPSVRSVTFSNAAANYVLAGASGGSLTLLNAGTSAASLAVTSGSHTISSAVSLGSNAAVDAAANSRLTIGGVVSGAQNLAKTGAGTLVLSGSNTYGGTTTVAAGRLLIHGNQLAATGAITVESGATLGGRGVTGGAVTVLAGGTLSPGASVESLAVGATTFSGSSTFSYEVDSSAPLSAGADLLAVSGNLSIENGSILQFTDLAAVPSAFTLGTKFTLISYGTNAWDGGFFTYDATPLTDGAQFTAGLNDWRIDYNDTTGGSNFPADQAAGSYVTITAVAVPEPSTIAMLAAGALTLGFFGFRPRRRRASA